MGDDFKKEMVGFCCFSRKSKPKERPMPPAAPKIPPEKPVAPTLHHFDSPHVRIATCFTEADIVELQLTPRGTIRNAVHFSCPVCLNYFNKVLVSQCCHHYLCHRCAKELAERPATFDVRCPQCNADPLVLTDVDPKKSVKLYSDSFANGKGEKPAPSHQPLEVINELDTARKDSFDDIPVKDSPAGMDDSYSDNRV